MLEYFGFSSTDEDDRSLFIAYIEGFVVLVQNQYRGTHQPPLRPLQSLSIVAFGFTAFNIPIQSTLIALAS